ncbi:MAG: pentapeptide repeat-containing protein [Nitrososphaerales archaeon]
MQTERKQMTGEDFIRKILEGERNFYGIELEYNFDLGSHELFENMQDYLRKQNLAKFPIIINNSDLSGVKASGLYLPHANFEGSILWNSNFEYSILNFANFHNADLTYTDFRHSELDHADFRNAVLQHVNFKHANLYFSDFRDANFDFIQLFGADLVLADLRGVRNLQKSLNLRCATFAETKVTPREEAIIRNISENGKSFEVEG